MQLGGLRSGLPVASAPLEDAAGRADDRGPRSDTLKVLGAFRASGEGAADGRATCTWVPNICQFAPFDVRRRLPDDQASRRRLIADDRGLGFEIVEEK